MRRKYSTTTEDDGVNYRNIADVMTTMGFPMNHSSARNHVIKALAKFASAYTSLMYDMRLSYEQLLAVARRQEFQSMVAEVFHVIEADDRKSRDAVTRLIFTDHDLDAEIAAETDAVSTLEEEKDDVEDLARRDRAVDIR